jgi:hypothetical protein
MEIWRLRDYGGAVKSMIAAFVLFLVLAFASAGPNSQAQSKAFNIRGGGYELKLRLSASKLSPALLSGCWGDPGKPAQINAFKLSLKGEEIYIPCTAYIDLLSIDRAWIADAREGCVIHLQGGEASTGYRAELHITRRTLKYRIVRQAEFPDKSYEKTEYHFPITN